MDLRSLWLAAAVLSVSAACQTEDLTQPDVPHVTQRDSVVRQQLAVALANNDFARASTLAAELPTAELALAESELSTLDPDPATWGPAQISMWDVGAKIGTPGVAHENYAFATVRHNGHMGETTLAATIRDSRGNVVQEYRRTIPDRNWFGPLLFKTLMHSINLMPPTACGHSIAVTGAVAAWFLPLVPSRYDLYYQPSLPGYTARGKSAGDAQPACPTDDEDEGDDTGDDTGDDSGDSGGSTGNSYTINMCHYIDWYNGDGTFLFTEFVGCETITLEM